MCLCEELVITGEAFCSRGEALFADAVDDATEPAGLGQESEPFEGGLLIIPRSEARKLVVISSEKV